MTSNNIQNIDFTNALSERYLSYALSTIMSRSLPDVRDGLKPVHRRLLYAMLQLKLDPDSAYKKCARVVGDVIGKYHPHGDVAIYDTLVRLAQNFSLRYPLIDGQGNFGSIDGDNAAAMRYTESRMTEICTFLMTDIDKDTVDFRNTYDDSDTEPVLMPTMFPNLLANGSEGIAVGMATSIPSHNLHELCDALLYLIDNPEATISNILTFIQGPDFPTGGIIIDDRNFICQNYIKGRGSFRVRARFHTETMEECSNYKIIINEIPYQVSKSKILEQIAALLKNKQLPLINTIRDESATDIRIVIESKKIYSPELVMTPLFKLTDLESRIQLNMNVICPDQIPRVMNILQILQEFLAHRQTIITRRSQFLINKIDLRLEILQGLKIAYINLDEIISIIRIEDNPKQIMISKFDLTDMQVEAILNIRLRSLRKLDEYEIVNEYNKLQQEHAVLTEVLSNPKQLWKIVKSEIKVIQTKFGINTAIGKRRTSFIELSTSPQPIEFSDILPRESVTIVCSKMGWIRCIKGHNYDVSTIKYKEGDTAQFILEAYDTDKVILCSSQGRVFTMSVHNIHQGKGHGESIKLMIDIGNHHLVNLFVYTPDQRILLATSVGKGFIALSNDLLAQTKLGKQIITVPANHQCIACIAAVTGNTVACASSGHKLLIFDLHEIPIMKRGQGVILQKFKDAKLTDITTFDSEHGLKWFYNNKTKTEKNIIIWKAKRGNIGKLPPPGFPKGDNRPFV